MHQIPCDENKISALHIYLEANMNDDEGDSWIFGHIPTMKNFIDSMDQTECEKLCSELWTWDKKIIYHLADTFLEVTNPNIDVSYMYGMIFLKIEDLEECEYLIENIHVLNDKINSRPEQFYLDVLDKIKIVGVKINRDFGYWIGQVGKKVNR